MSARLFVALACLTLTLGCQPDFRPETLVENLRVLGIRAEPADLKPAERTRLDSLIVDPSRPGKSPTVLWLACDPDPFNLNRTVCSDPRVLNDPSALAGEGGQLPPGVRVVGLGKNAVYQAPAGLFDVLPADDARRVSGTVAQFIAFAVAESVSPAAPQAELEALLRRVRAKEVRSLLTLFRVRISESPERNSNPTLSGLFVGGEVWPQGAAILALPGEPVLLEGRALPEVFEPYTQETPNGPEAKEERLLLAWYSSAGRFSESSTAIGGQVQTAFTAPGLDPKDPLPEGRSGFLTVVVRDTRGGMSWHEHAFFVCDDTLPEPDVQVLKLEGEKVVALGPNAEHLQDVVVDGIAVVPSSASAGRWEGVPRAALSSGPHAVRLHAKTCSRKVGPVLTVP